MAVPACYGARNLANLGHSRSSNWRLEKGFLPSTLVFFASMSVILTDSDYDELKRELGLSVPRIKQSLASEDNMGQLSVAQLKTIIRFLKVRFRVHIAVSGRKDQLIDNIAGTIYSSGICIPHPTVHSVPTT